MSQEPHNEHPDHCGQAITVADDSAIIRLVERARNRLVVLAPAVSNGIADAICSRWQELGTERVSVILDVDPEVYRLGYGQIEALARLEQVAASLGTMLQRQPGVRIGLVISDDLTLVYSPTPQLVEASPQLSKSRENIKPNAVLLDHAPAQIANDLGHGEQGVRTQTVGLDKARRGDIEEVKKDLDQNPPQKFDIARKVRVFNAAFEFVEFELAGTYIDRKTVPIPHHLSGIADVRTREQLRTSFTLLPPDHKLSGEHLAKDKDLIAKQFLRAIKGYGTVILRSRKEAFEKEVETLRAAVDAFGRKIRDELQGAMDKTRENLTKAMLPLVRRTTPKNWLRSDGSKPDAETLRQFLEDDLRRAFGTAEKLINRMDVRLVFKGVTYESLTNDAFISAAREAIPELQKMYEEFDAVKAERPGEPSPQGRTGE